MARYGKFKYGGYFTDDFSGALGVGWDGATWSTAGGKAYNTPTLGPQLLVDPELEIWSSPTDLTNWSETIAGTSTINQETVIVNSLLSSARFDIDAGGSLARIGQVPSDGGLDETWYIVSGYLRTSHISKTVALHISGNWGKTRQPGTTWTPYVDVFRTTSAGQNFGFVRGSSSSSSMYGDDINVYRLTLSELFATRVTQIEIETSVAIDIVDAGTKSGLVTHLDSAASPANFLIAYHSGAGGQNCFLDKCVAGVYSNVIAGTATHVAGAIIQVKAYLSGGSLKVSLFYNGVQVGAEETVADAGIVSNVRHGMFSTYVGNSFDDYDLRGYGVTARGTMYGVSVSKALRWAIEVDWDGDGVFTGENEADHCMGYNLRRGREFFMKSDGSGFEPVRIGTVALTLLNEDRRYDPYYAAGDLFGLLDRNQHIRIRVMDESTSIIYARFDGYIDDIRPNYGTPSTVTLIASDGLKVLTNKKIRSSGVYTTIRYNIALAQCLTDAGWAGASSIDSTVSDTMPYWWTSGNSAFSEMQDLNDAMLGRLFAADDGTITYKSRMSSDAPIYIMLDSDVLESFKIRVPTPREVIRNLIRIYARARTAQAAVELWRAVDQPLIPTGGSITVWANFSYNGQDVPATVVTDPVNGVDYTCSVGGIITHVMTTFATSAKIVFTNAGVPATMTLMKLRGTCITTDEYTFAEDSDAASIINYGEREFVIMTDWLQDINTAIDQVASLKVLLSTPRQYPRVLLRHNVAKQFGVDLFDIVSVNFVSMGYADDLRIGYIEENWTIPTGDVVDTVLGFEPNMAGALMGTWIFPAIFGLTTVFA